MHRSRTCTDTIQGQSTDSITVIGANPGAHMGGIDAKNGANGSGAGTNGESMSAGTAIVGVTVIIGDTKARDTRIDEHCKSLSRPASNQHTRAHLLAVVVSDACQ
jgi:hypothetical protein